MKQFTFALMLVLVGALMLSACRFTEGPAGQPPPGTTVTLSEAPAAAAPAVVADTPVTGTLPLPFQSNGEVCRLDKIATAYEVQGAGAQRIEVGGGGTQHADLYPMQGVPSISYIVGPQEPIIMMGFGSIWEGNGAPCQAFDWVKDAKGYAEGRLNNGHSGLVLDLRNGRRDVVANLNGLSQDQIAALLSQHAMAAQGTNVAVTDAVGLTIPSFDRYEAENTAPTAEAETVIEALPTTVAPVARPTTAAVAAPAVQAAPVQQTAVCGNAVRNGDADGKTLVVPAGQTYVVQAWSPQTGDMVFSAG